MVKLVHSTAQWGGYTFDHPRNFVAAKVKENHVQIVHENLEPSVRMLNVGRRPAFHQDNDFKHCAKVARDGPHQDLHFRVIVSLRTGGGTSPLQEASTFCIIVPILSRGR